LKRDERAIRAINCRDLASEGTVPVVFFDIRAAKVLKDLVEDVNHTYLHDTLVVKESGKRLAARFVTVDELSKVKNCSAKSHTTSDRFNRNSVAPRFWKRLTDRSNSPSRNRPRPNNDLAFKNSSKRWKKQVYLRKRLPLVFVEVSTVPFFTVFSSLSVTCGILFSSDG